MKYWQKEINNQLMELHRETVNRPTLTGNSFLTKSLKKINEVRTIFSTDDASAQTTALP